MVLWVYHFALLVLCWVLGCTFLVQKVKRDVLLAGYFADRTGLGYVTSVVYDVAFQTPTKTLAFCEVNLITFTYQTLGRNHKIIFERQLKTKNFKTIQ